MKKILSIVSILTIFLILFSSFSFVLVEAKTKPTKRLKAPSISIITTTSNSATFKIKNTNDAKLTKSYTVQIRTVLKVTNKGTSTSKWKTIKAISKKKTKYTIKKLKKSTNYQIRIKANGVNSKKTSEYSSIKSFMTTKPASLAKINAEAVLKLVNKERKKLGLNSLKLSDELNKIALTKSKDMAVNKYFSHQSPKYGSPFEMLQSFGVSYYTAGENIAAGQTSPKSVMNSWMNSPGHRANILNPNYTELGVGYYKGGSYGHYWTQVFVGR